jgi:glycosyltransferase involved in cell wall biosynthesis
MRAESIKKIAVVIPCYNEAASIATVIGKFPKASLLQQGFVLDVYVIDNNCTDATSSEAKKAGAYVLQEVKKGKGNALRTGFAGIAADTDYVVMLDGDDTYSPEEILRVVEPLQSDFCDVVVGSRLGGKIQHLAMDRLNYFGNRLFTMAVRLLYRANVTDVLTGYFAWKKSALDELRPHIQSTGFAIEMEMITKMARLGHQMTSVPISYHPRQGESNLRPFHDGIRILMMLLKNLVWRPSTIPMANGSIPRKMVFVSDSIYPYMMGGKEKRLHEITKRLASMGHDVHIYTMHWWSDPGKVRTEDGVKIHALCNYHQMYSQDKRTIKEAVIFGFSCLKLLRVQFDILDVDHMPFFPIFSAWVVCALRRRRLHGTWHEALSRSEWTRYMGRGGLLASCIERLSIRLPHSITAASAQTKELLESIHGRARGVEIVASGIDTELLNAVQPAERDCDVLYVGRLVKDKNVEMLIDAIRILRERDPTIQCMIIGQGPEEARLKKMVIEKDLRENIIFQAPLPQAADVYAYMKAAKVFCSPSVREGFGIVSLEALGCGTPVITIDSPGNAARHLIRDGENGSIVPLIAEALADAIYYWVSLTHMPDIAAQVADSDWHQLAERQAEVYGL